MKITVFRPEALPIWSEDRTITPHAAPGGF
ncbi:hypothetical protein QF037_003980 [Streptomyces canus]|nr:hypothetical protein [Streptomyces canus]